MHILLCLKGIYKCILFCFIGVRDQYQKQDVQPGRRHGSLPVQLHPERRAVTSGQGHCNHRHTHAERAAGDRPRRAELLYRKVGQNHILVVNYLFNLRSTFNRCSYQSTAVETFQYKFHSNSMNFVIIYH